MQRNNTIDLIRLIAAFCVMSLHVSLPDFGFDYDAIIRLSMRWAVPFFFILTGYFLGFKISTDNKLDFKRIEKNIVSLISVLIISSVVFFAYQFFIYEFWFNNEIGFLWQGTYWHLWFIGSMLLGYIFIWYIYYIEWNKYMWLISILILLLALLSDSYDVVVGLQIEYNKIPRFLISIPFMYIGMLFSKFKVNKLSISLVILILITGFMLQFGELYFLQQLFNYNIYDHQLLFGIIITTISIFIISIKVKVKSNLISKFGRRYSLFIYLYHIIVYWFIYKIIYILKINTDISVFIPLIGFILILSIAIVLDKYLPRVFNFLLGNIFKIS